jgi:hypothetical protein
MTCAAANIQEGTAKQANVQMKTKLCILSNAQQKVPTAAIALKASCALRGRYKCGVLARCALRMLKLLKIIRRRGPKVEIST